MASKIHTRRPCFSIEHFTSNIFLKRNGRIDIKCLIHALTFNFIFFERDGIRHKKANRIHGVI